MDPVEAHPELVFDLVIDDNGTVPHSRKRTFRIAAALMALYQAGTNLRHVWRVRTYRYLNRPELLDNPRVETPWQAILRSRVDRAFITTTGVDVATFDYILDSGFRNLWYTHPIQRDDVNPTGSTRLGRRSLDAEGALGALLHYLSGTMGETSLQEIFALVPSVLTRYIHFSLSILALTLEKTYDARISWPNAVEMQEYSDAITEQHPSIVGAFGFLDGLSLPVGTSNDPEIERSTYNGWLHSHRISNILVFAPDGCIIAAKVNAPGSWHDSRTATHIYDLLRNRTNAGFFLIADTAFPRGGNNLAGKIETPLKHNSVLPNNPIEAQEAIEYSNSITSACQPAEWGMRAIQGAYGRLWMPLDIGDPIGRRALLETCFRLHNLRTRRIGINQIRTVYMREWGSDTDRFFHDLHSCLFPEIRNNDRVQRFYLQVLHIP